MFEIAVCDDKGYMRAEIISRLLRYSFQHELDHHIDEYWSGEELLGSHKEYGLIFMGYKFGKKRQNGIEIARQLRERGSEAGIVFVTSHPEAVFDAFEVDAFRFLLKPIDEEKLYEAFDAFLFTKSRDEVTIVRSDGDVHFVKTSTVLYAEAFGKHAVIHFADAAAEPLEINETLGSFERRISPEHFYRCHKSYLVNLKYVSFVNRNEVGLVGRETVLLSRTRYDDIIETIWKYKETNHACSCVHSKKDSGRKGV